MGDILSPGLKILLCDDSTSIQRAIQLSLKKHASVLKICNHGLKLVEEALKFNPDIIIIDVTLPDVSGLDICETIKQNKILKHKKIVMLCNSFEEVDEEKLNSLNCDAKLWKPFEAKVFIELMQTLSPENTKKTIADSDYLLANSDTIAISSKDAPVNSGSVNDLSSEILASSETIAIPSESDTLASSKTIAIPSESDTLASSETIAIPSESDTLASSETIAIPSSDESASDFDLTEHTLENSLPSYTDEIYGEDPEFASAKTVVGAKNFTLPPLPKNPKIQTKAIDDSSNETMVSLEDFSSSNEQTIIELNTKSDANLNIAKDEIIAEGFGENEIPDTLWSSDTLIADVKNNDSSINLNPDFKSYEREKVTGLSSLGGAEASKLKNTKSIDMLQDVTISKAELKSVIKEIINEELNGAFMKKFEDIVQKRLAKVLAEIESLD